MEDLEKKDVMTREATDDKLINDAFQRLLDSYLASPHRRKVDIITAAFNFARQAHKGVRRLSGEPYIMHPIAVAQIASEEMGLGSTSICAALLHDVVEDTEYNVEDIANLFGPKIAQIVEGLTKISGGLFGDKASAQTENFKKLLLTMNEDIRVILIKICDRLHNMRTLDSQPANKKYKIAGETQFIYAPLANRLGLYKIKSELENLSFRYEHPELYEDIVQQLKLTKEERDQLFTEFTAPIKKMLDRKGYNYEIKARVKSPYSIWCKMQKKHVSFDEIFDILAVRIIFEPKTADEAATVKEANAREGDECYSIYLGIRKLYKYHPDRVRDWLDQAKPNGYRALHATFMSKQGKWVEVQIRSRKMDDIAEQGIAAHWKYKSQEPDEPNEETEFNDWLRTIKEILDDPQPDAMDFLDTVKMNLFSNEIFVFTPKGEIMTMPAGSTVLDFAFQIHTFLGSHCMGAKVNHKLQRVNYQLKSGDQVEILTSKVQHVVPEWVDYVSSAKAKQKVQAILRRYDREKQKKGEEVLNEWLRSHEMELTMSTLDRLCETHEIQRRENFLQALGDGSIVLSNDDIDELRGKKRKKRSGGWKKFVPFIKSKPKEEKPKTIMAEKKLLEVGKNFNKKIPCIITEETIGMYVFPDCCHPIPGDDILGFINDDNHVEIHMRACPIADKLKSSYGNRILDARWEMHNQLFFDAALEIHGIDRKGMLRDLSDVISDQFGMNIHKITVSAEEGIFSGTIDLAVHDRAELGTLMDQLKKIEDMQEVLQMK